MLVVISHDHTFRGVGVGTGKAQQIAGGEAGFWQEVCSSDMPL